MSPATLDLLVVGLVLAVTVAGALSGALRQLVQVAALLGGWLAARFLALPAAVQVFGPRALPWQRALAAGFCFLLALLAVAVLGRFLARRLHGASGRPGPADRGVGALLGGAKGALLAWLLLSVLVRLSPLELGRFLLDAPRSDLGALAARHDLLGSILPRQARGLDLVIAAVRDPAARERLIRSDPGLKRLLDDPRLKPLLDRLAARPDQPGAPGVAPQDQSALEELLQSLRQEEARP